MVSVATPPSAQAYNQHLCGLYGTWIGPQQSCPGISPRHSWKRAVVYRNSAAQGIDMCLIVRNADNNYMFSRCYFYATSIWVGPTDLNYGRQLTRIYNKNNNVALGYETRWAYADTN